MQMLDTSKPRLFLWELVSFANEWGPLGNLDSKGYDDRVEIGLPPSSKWRIWTRHDRRGQMPEGVAPERFYLHTNLRSRNPLGDYVRWGERAVQVVSARYAKLLAEMGQTDYQLFPLTIWWWPPRGDLPADRAPPHDPTETFQALHCWKDAEVFDLERSSFEVMNLPQKDANRLRGEFDPPEGDLPTARNVGWKKLVLRTDVPIVLPPMYRIPTIQGTVISRYVSPQMKDEIERRKLKVEFAKRYVDYEYEAQLTEAYHEARVAATRSNAIIKFDHPEEIPLGC